MSTSRPSELLCVDGKPLLFNSDRTANKFLRELRCRGDWLIIPIEIIGPDLSEL